MMKTVAIALLLVVIGTILMATVQETGEYLIITLCPKSPSARSFVACLPIRLLFKPP